MSSSDDNALVAYVATIMPYEYCLFAGTALLLYDTFLTLGTEVNVMWRPKFSVKALIHILNRYGAIAAYISAVVLLFPVNDRMCHTLGLFESICTVLPYVAWSLFSSLRIYALSNCNIALSIFVLVLNMMYIVPDIYNDCVSSFFNDLPPYGCYQNAADDNVIVPLLWTSRGTLLLGEVWTFKKTVRWRSTRLIRMYGSSQMLSEVLFNNGVACFAVPLVFNVITLALTLANTDMAASVGQCVVVFRDALTTILISRFLLDLGAFGVPNNGTDASTEGAGLGTMQFASELSDSHAESEGSVKRGTTWMSEDEYELGAM